jgi:hypothetical protein
MIRLEPPAEKEEDSYYEELRNSPVKEMDLEEDETAATAPACSVQKDEIVAKPQTLALVLYQPPLLLLLPAASEPKTECVPESGSSSSAPESGNCLAEAPAPKAQPVAQLSATSSRKNTPMTDCFFLTDTFTLGIRPFPFRLKFIRVFSKQKSISSFYMIAHNFTLPEILFFIFNFQNWRAAALPAGP